MGVNSQNACTDGDRLWVSRRGLLTIAAVFVIGLTTVGQPNAQSPDSSSADSSSSRFSNYLSGKVTDKQGETVEIDKKVYKLSSTMSIKDVQGNVLDEIYIISGLEVRFRLNHGSIEELIVFLPR
jgi:hypothetical protein